MVRWKQTLKYIKGLTRQGQTKFPDEIVLVLRDLPFTRGGWWLLFEVCCDCSRARRASFGSVLSIQLTPRSTRKNEKVDSWCSETHCRLCHSTSSYSTSTCNQRTKAKVSLSYIKTISSNFSFFYKGMPKMTTSFRSQGISELWLYNKNKSVILLFLCMGE